MEHPEISILIVEDEPPIQSILLDVLSPKFKCWGANSASSAIRLMETRFFHLALVDSGLPGMSGISLCRLIVNRFPLTGVVIVSGSTDPQSIDQAMRAGAIEYVTKPFDLSHIVAIVERCVRRHLPGSAA
jgi:DNA-binding response OmpR family regulator